MVQQRDGHGTSYRYSLGCPCDVCREGNRVRAAEARKKRKQRIQPPTLEHGKATTYSNWGCRCEECVAASAEASGERRAGRLSRPQDIPHGTVSGYQNWGCRCYACRMARHTPTHE